MIDNPQASNSIVPSQSTGIISQLTGIASQVSTVGKAFNHFFTNPSRQSLDRVGSAICDVADRIFAIDHPIIEKITSSKIGRLVDDLAMRVQIQFLKMNGNNSTSILLGPAFDKPGMRGELFKTFGTGKFDFGVLRTHVEKMSGEAQKAARKNLIRLTCSLLGHEWGLRGHLWDGDGMDIEGQPPDVSHMRLANTVNTYSQDCKDFLIKSGLSIENQQAVGDCLQLAAQCTAPTFADDTVQAFNDGKPVTIPTGWYDHAVEVTLCKGRSENEAYLVYTNRGDEPHERGKMVVYKFNPQTHPITEDFITNLASLRKMAATDQREDRMRYFQSTGLGTMQAELGLEYVQSIEKKYQKTGNCAWANGKGGFYAAMMLVMMRDKPAGTSNEVALTEANDQAKKIYKNWEASSRYEALQRYIALKEQVLAGQTDITRDQYVGLLRDIETKLREKKFARTAEARRANEMIADIQQALKDF